MSRSVVIKSAVSALAGAGLLLAVVATSSAQTPSPTPTTSPTATPTATATPSPTATVTPTATPTPGGGIISGSVPAGGGFGVFVYGGGTIDQLIEATGCPVSSMAVWTTEDGEFVVYVPAAQIGAVNAAFLALFPNDMIPASTAFIGKCR